MTAPPIEIITAGPSVVVILSRLHRDCFANGWDTEEMASIIAMPGTTGLLAISAETAIESRETEQIPVGFLLGREAADEAEILSVGVLPQSRSRGIGRRLMDDFCASVSKRRAHTIFLEVAVDNAAALSLYRNLGFISVGIRNLYYDVGGATGGKVDAYVMQKQLNDQASHSGRSK